MRSSRKGDKRRLALGLADLALLAFARLGSTLPAPAEAALHILDAFLDELLAVLELSRQILADLGDKPLQQNNFLLVHLRLEIEVRPEQNLLFVRGAVPGGDNALILITKG